MGAAVSQMFEQALDVLRGFVPQFSLEKVRPLDATLLSDATEVPAGRVAHIAADGEWELGATGHQVPHFLWQGKNDADVQNPGTSPTTDVTYWVGIGPNGRMRGLPATGAFELQTTEFDDAQTYLPNEMLKSDGSGKLTNQTVVAGTHCLCGMATWHENAEFGPSRDGTSPKGTNAHGVTVLTFYTYFLPVHGSSN